MKIVFISGYFYPEQTADTHLNSDIVEGLSELGHDVKVIVPFPSRGISLQEQEEYLNKHREKKNNHLEIIRVGKIKKYNNSFIKKSLFLLKNTKLLYKETIKHDADVYFIVSSPPFLGKIAIKLKKRKKRVVYKLQDVFPDSLIHSKSISERNVLIKVLRKFEKKVYSSCDTIIACSNDVKETLLKRNVSADKIKVIYDWVDETSCCPVLNKDNILRKKYGLLDTDFVVYYAGNLGYLQDLKTMLNAACELRDYDIKFLIIGNGMREQEIRNFISQNNLENRVFMYPLEKVDMVSYVYSVGDVGLVMLLPQITNYAFPSKTWSVLSAGRAVICEAEDKSNLASLIKSNELGDSFDPYDYNKLASLILNYYHNRDICFKIGKNGRKFIEDKLNKKIAIEKISKII